MVIVKSAVPAAFIEDAEKLLETVGLDWDTESTSADEHTPATVHEAETLVLTTLEGGAMEAMFVT